MNKYVSRKEMAIKPVSISREYLSIQINSGVVQKHVRGKKRNERLFVIRVSRVSKKY